MTLLHLLWSFFQIGLFSIGGGYAAMPLIQSQVVDQYGWLTMQEFTDLITIAEMTPSQSPSIPQRLWGSALRAFRVRSSQRWAAFFLR